MVRLTSAHGGGYDERNWEGQMTTTQNFPKEYYFSPDRLEGVPLDVVSPSGKYQLSKTSYKTGKGYWNFTRGVVIELSNGEVIADIKRNYSHFWHLFVEHPNGNEYLLCGEDYQGYTVVNLTKRMTRSYLPDSAQFGAGFCWIHADFFSDGLELRVDGCYWGAPEETVYYDFRNPDELPLPELRRAWIESDDDEDDRDDSL